RLQRRRTTIRRRRRLGTGLLHFKNSVERRHRSARRRVTELRGQFRLSGLGQDRNGRLERYPFRRRGRIWNRLARRRSSPGSNGKDLETQERYSAVDSLTADHEGITDRSNQRVGPE